MRQARYGFVLYELALTLPLAQLLLLRAVPYGRRLLGDKQCAAWKAAGILQTEKAEMLDNKKMACWANVGIERKLLK